MTDGEVKRSEGTVDIRGSTLTLKPEGSNIPFTITAAGENMSAISGTITFTSGEMETKTAVSLTTVPVDVGDTFNLDFNKWDTGESWANSINLTKFIPFKPKQGDEFQFMINGTLDKALERFGISLAGHTSDWSGYQWLGGVGEDNMINVSAGTFFSHTFPVTIWNDPIPDYIINVTISCSDTDTPADIPQWTTMRTIIDFEIYLVGIRNENDEREAAWKGREKAEKAAAKAAVKAFVDNDNRIPPNLTLTGFDSKYNGMYVYVFSPYDDARIPHNPPWFLNAYEYFYYKENEDYVKYYVFAQISGGSVALRLNNGGEFAITEDYDIDYRSFDYYVKNRFIRYTGNDKNVKIYFYVFKERDDWTNAFASSTWWSVEDNTYGDGTYRDDDRITVDFTNGAGTASVAGKIFDY
jgi:hypothetical protein